MSNDSNESNDYKNYKGEIPLTETQRLLELLNNSDELPLSEIGEDQMILKVVDSDGFLLITLAKAKKNRGGRVLHFKDVTLIYVNSPSYKMAETDYTFNATKDYPNIGFFTIPKSFFPEYYL